MAERVVDLRLPIRIWFKKFRCRLKVRSTGQVEVPAPHGDKLWRRCPANHTIKRTCARSRQTRNPEQATHQAATKLLGGVLTLLDIAVRANIPIS